MNLQNQHNKKSDYVGNHGGRYTDLGQSKQFTYIDHDPKVKSFHRPGETDFQREWRELEEFLEPRKATELFLEFLRSVSKIYEDLNLGEMRLLKKSFEQGKIIEK